MIEVREDDCTKCDFKTASMILADPPQVIGPNNFKDTSPVFTATWIRNVSRYFASECTMIVLTDPKFTFEYEQMLRRTCMHWVQTIIWHNNFGRYTRAHFVASHTNILVFQFGKPRFYWDQVAVESSRQRNGDTRADARGRTPDDVWTDIPMLPGNSEERMNANAQLPLKLIKRLIGAYTQKGDTVLDPFCGNGTVPKACQEMGRSCVAVDIDPVGIEATKARLSREYDFYHRHKHVLKAAAKQNSSIGGLEKARRGEL